MPFFIVKPPVRHGFGDLFGEREIVLLWVLQLDQMHRLVRFTRSDLDRHTIAQQVVGAQIRLIKCDAGYICRSFQFLQRRRNVGLGIAPPLQIQAKQLRHNAAVALSLMPVAEKFVSKAVGVALVGEELDDAILCQALGSGLFGHVVVLQKFISWADGLVDCFDQTIHIGRGIRR